MRRKVNEAKRMIDEKREEVKVNAERSDKAEWAISLCNSRVIAKKPNLMESYLTRTEIHKC